MNRDLWRSLKKSLSSLSINVLSWLKRHGVLLIIVCAVEPNSIHHLLFTWFGECGDMISGILCNNEKKNEHYTPADA